MSSLAEFDELLQDLLAALHRVIEQLDFLISYSLEKPKHDG